MRSEPNFAWPAGGAAPLGGRDLQAHPSGRNFFRTASIVGVLVTLAVGTGTLVLVSGSSAPPIRPTPEATASAVEARVRFLTATLTGCALAAPIALVLASVVRFTAVWRARGVAPDEANRALADAQGCLAGLLGCGPVATLVSIGIIGIVAAAPPIDLSLTLGVAGAAFVLIVFAGVTVPAARAAPHAAREPAGKPLPASEPKAATARDTLPPGVPPLPS